LEEKAKSWQAWETTGRSMKKVLEKIRTTRPNEVVSLGLNLGQIVELDQGFVLHATAQVSQKLRDLHMTGTGGELADVLSKFPELKIDGVFHDKYGSGTVHQAEQRYEHKGEDGEETILMNL
jgi:hypothetical protein